MSKPIPLLIIQRAREIIDDQRWCRGSYARGKAGASVSVHHPDARRFCAMGALLLAASELCGTDTSAASNLAHETAKLLSPTGSLVFINDFSGHAAVLSLFDAAIASFA